MEYAGYRLSFRQGVHFGSTTVESAEMTFGADRLFSALCQEAVSAGEDKLAELYGLAEKGALLLSDAFPYLGAEYYLPKPLLRIQAKGRETDARERKKYKKLSYVPIEEFDAFVAGEADIDALGKQEFGERTVKTSVNLWGEEATPYRIGTYNFSVENDGGLYILVAGRIKRQNSCWKNCWICSLFRVWEAGVPQAWGVLNCTRQICRRAFWRDWKQKRASI